MPISMGSGGAYPYNMYMIIRAAESLDQAMALAALDKRINAFVYIVEWMGRRHLNSNAGLSLWHDLP